MSKTAFIRHLQLEPGWWHDERFGIQPGRQFRAWALKIWRILKKNDRADARSRKRRRKAILWEIRTGARIP